jgi:murein L,D-transpeptidase YcbB/YkuD
MPNRYNVYMHDTPEQRLFSDSYRFLSHGCVRVEGIYDLAAWLLNTAGSRRHWQSRDLAGAAPEGRRREIKLPAPMPVPGRAPTAWSLSRRMFTSSMAPGARSSAA